LMSLISPKFHNHVFYINFAQSKLKMVYFLLNHSFESEILKYIHAVFLYNTEACAKQVKAK